MIVSHRHRFIFLRPRKVGGTSVEIALADLCGDDDIVTPMGEGTESEREGRRGPQNYRIPPSRWPLWRRMLVAFGMKERKAGVKLYNHMPAIEVRRLIGPAVFDAYLKIAIERNPWDREVSFYHYRFPPKQKDRPTFEQSLLDPRWKKPLRNFEVYSIGGRIVADVVLRYENLADDYAALVRRLGIEDPPPLPHARSAPRPDKSDYRSWYTPETREAVAKTYAREIAAFGYEF